MINTDRCGQSWSITTGEVDRSLTFTVLEEKGQPERGHSFWRCLLLLDTGCPERRFPQGTVLSVEDGPWELMSSHTRLG